MASRILMSPDLGPTYLQRSSADHKIPASKVRVEYFSTFSHVCHFFSGEGPLECSNIWMRLVQINDTFNMVNS